MPRIKTTLGKLLPGQTFYFSQFPSEREEKWTVSKPEVTEFIHVSTTNMDDRYLSTASVWVEYPDNPKLEARVRCENAANAEANRIGLELYKIFTPLVGQKVFKADGSLLKKYQGLLDGVLSESTPKLHAWHSSSIYSLCWTVRACETIKDGVDNLGNDKWYTCYAETSTYIADLEGDRIKRMYPIEQIGKHRTDYTVLEVQNARLAFNLAQKAFDNARSALGPFGEYDR